ncbi:MAG: hypothetical protein IJ852_04830 [Alphaproteobacteria bacterium]|nr:hypothetical protein [Alphaproteobacteria bacterium]
MTHIVSNHYSYKFKFDIDKLPARQKDRLSRKLSAFGFIFGVAFLALSVFDLISGYFFATAEEYDFETPVNFSAAEIMYQRYTFDGILFVLGAVVVFLSVLAFRRYKEIFFDGENIKITYNTLFGKPVEITESLANYLGVLLKVEYYQLGMINRNRYIIELYHKEKNKRVPLYIATKSDQLRSIWADYAEKLRQPMLFMTDHGLISRHYSERNRTLKDMAKKWQLKPLYRSEAEMPLSVKCRIKPNKTIVKERRIFFDIYTILAFLGVIILSALAIYAAMNSHVIISAIGIVGFFFGMFLTSVVILISLLILFSKDVLIITDDRVILGHNILFIRIDAETLMKKNVEAVDIGHNPTTDRYYLSVISDEQSLIFGKNMPLDDLRAVRGFVIREIVKN